MDGSIIASAIDCPGGWHDGLVFDRLFKFLRLLGNGLWILGDVGFARIPGRVERVRKEGEYLPHDKNASDWQLDLERFCGQIRVRAEWGLKDFKRSWLILSKPLPSDDHNLRKLIWTTSMRLHNFRQRSMRVGQIGNVFTNDQILEE